MSDVDDVSAALMAWALWVKGSRQSAGYPAVNVLHSSWLPPAPGTTPSMRTAPHVDDRRHRAMHEAIGRLSVRLANTVVTHYCYRLSVAEQCERLECAPSTLHQRLAAARCLIASDLKRRGSFTN